ncbi:MAG: DUF262 domain-containing protein, partial [Proteobacteria bacterium]
KEYTENKKKGNKNELAPRNMLQSDVLAVVDGQQRLSSLYIGLSGTYKYKKKGSGLQNIDANFVPSKLFINLFATEKRDGETQMFEFLAEDDAAFINDKHCWYEVGKVLNWKSVAQANQVLKEIGMRVQECEKRTVRARFEQRIEVIKEMLANLYRMIHDDQISYFEIDNQNLDEVVDIFTRVNSGGMMLKKSDLLFSILIAQWIDGRQEIATMVDTLNENDIEVSQDFVMRACLVLSDLPVKYNLESFTIKNVRKIQNNWEGIKESLIRLCGILPDIGYKNLPNLSANALLPIAYYLKKGGSIKTQKARRNLQLYYTVSQVNGVFGGQSDQVLEKIRTEINEQLYHDNILNYQKLSQLKLPGNKSLAIDLDGLNELVDTVKYGSPHAYFLLSLVYPSVDFKVRKYEVDHIHPRSKFNNSNLVQHGIEEERIELWKSDKKDLLPNLQLLAGMDNNNKRARTLVDYLKAKSKGEREAFMQDNLIPKDFDILRLDRFDDFYELRKRKLVGKLRSVFGL